MTQKNKIINNINKKIEEIKERLQSYENVDAMLSIETLNKTLYFLEAADNALENGFVKDACNEIDYAFSIN
jgi:Ni,Fe-hydrogenase III component G